MPVGIRLHGRLLDYRIFRQHCEQCRN
jgi:hypothetical protein